MENLYINNLPISDISITDVFEKPNSNKVIGFHFSIYNFPFYFETYYDEKEKKFKEPEVIQHNIIKLIFSYDCVNCPFCKTKEVTPRCHVLSKFTSDFYQKLIKHPSLRLRLLKHPMKK